MDFSYGPYCSKKSDYFSSETLDEKLIDNRLLDEYNISYSLNRMFAVHKRDECSENVFKAKLCITVCNSAIQKIIPLLVDELKKTNRSFSIPRSLECAKFLNSNKAPISQVFRMVEIPFSDLHVVRTLLDKLKPILEDYPEGPHLWTGAKVQCRSAYFELADRDHNSRKNINVKDVAKRIGLCILPRHINEDRDLNTISEEKFFRMYKNIQVTDRLNNINAYSAYRVADGLGVSLFEAIEGASDIGMYNGINRMIQTKELVNEASSFVPEIPHVNRIFSIEDRCYEEKSEMPIVNLHQLIAHRYPFSVSSRDEGYIKNVETFVLRLESIVNALHERNIAIGGFDPFSIRTVDFRTFRFSDLSSIGNSCDLIQDPDTNQGTHNDLNRMLMDNEALWQTVLFLFSPRSSMSEFVDTCENRLLEIETRFGPETAKFVSRYRQYHSDESIPRKRNYSFARRYSTIHDLSTGVSRHLCRSIDSKCPSLIHSDPRVWIHENENFGLSFGGSGAVLALHKYICATTEIDQWLVSACRSLQELSDFSGGLFDGPFGIIAALIADKRYQTALGIAHLVLTSDSSIPEHDLSLRNGASGIGLVLLELFDISKDPVVRVGLDKCIEKSLTSFVSAEEYSECFPKETPTGLMDGLSGLSLFLAKSGYQLHDHNLVQTSQRMLDREISKFVLSPEGAYLLPWKDRLMPYAANGSSGILFPILELSKSIQINNYTNTILGVLKACDSTTVFVPGLFDGAAGLLLGASISRYLLISELSQKNISIHHATENLRKFLLCSSDGIRVPGSYCLKLSDDFATGASGVLWSLNLCRKYDKALCKQQRTTRHCTAST